MPPVIVGIAAGVAAAGVVSTAAAIAIGIGAAALTYAATPKFDGGSFANEAFSQQQMLRSPVEPRRGIYGRAMVSGPLVFAEETGTDNAYLHLVIPLAGHRCDGIEKIYFGDDVAWANGALTSKYASVARIKIHLGNQTTSDPDLTAECRQWTSAHVGFGVTYLYARLKFDTKVFPNGVPNIKALVRGKQVYDPRKTTHNWSDPATWEWSDNWALCCLDYNRFESGVGAAAHEIDLSYFAAAANDSDQLVEYKTGKFEKRYTCNGTYNTDVSPSSIMEKMLTAGAGMHVYVSGQYRLYAGVYQGPEVLVLTEDDAAGDIDVRPYTPRAELCNAVRGTFVDPENFYQPTDFPPYESSYYRAQDDGEYIDHDLDLPFTQSVWTAQRLGKLYLEQKRAGMQISMPVKMIGVAVSVGKVVGLSLPRLGIDGTFQIVDWQFDYGKPVSLILVETSPELFDYAMGSYTERDLTPNVILPNPATVPTPVGLQYVEYQDDPQWQGELTWSAPANNSSYRYVIEVSNGLGEVVYQTNADATHLLLPKFDAGFYTVSVWALNLFANRSNAPATITIGATLPAPVTGIEVIAGPLTLTLRPTTAAAIAQTTQFEILGSITNNIADAALIGTGKDAVWPDRHPNTRYQVWARTINNYGASSWYGPVQATTSADNSSIIDLIGNTFKSYTWFAWADDNQGTGFTTVEALGDGKAYMGLATDKPTATPSGNWQDYTWSKIKPDIGPIFTPEEEAKLDNLLAGKLPNAPDKDMLAAQDALNNPALANNLITALSLLNQGINAPALGGETPASAQAKADSAKAAALADPALRNDAYYRTLPDFFFERGLLCYSTGYEGPSENLFSLNYDPAFSVVKDGEHGGNILRVNGERWVYGIGLIPVDTSKRYKMRIKVRQFSNGTGRREVYAGVVTLDKNLNFIYSEPGTHRYCCAIGVNISEADGWHVLEGYITGAGNDSFNQFRVGTAYIRPMLIVNYANGNGIADIDELSFYEVTDKGDLIAIGMETSADAQAKAEAAKNAAIVAAAADASAKANTARAQAEASAALDALNKQNYAISTAKSYTDNNRDGANLVKNSAFLMDTVGNITSFTNIPGWNGWTFNINTYQIEVWRNGDWALKGGATAVLYQAGTGTGTTNKDLTLHTENIPVVAGKKYCFAGYLGVHRCSAALFGAFYDKDDTQLLVTQFSMVYFSEGYIGGRTTNSFKRLQSFGIAPSNAAYMRLYVRKYDTDDGFPDSYLFFTRVSACIVSSDTTVAPEWTPGLEYTPDVQNDNAIKTIELGNFNANIGLINTLLASSGLFDALKARIGNFGGLTAETIASLAIATNHLQAGAVTAEKLTADTALIQKLISNIGLFNQLQAQIAAFGGLAANSIAAKAITVDKLDVLSRNLVNNFSLTGDAKGWSGFPLVDHWHAGQLIKAMEITTSGNVEGFCEPFDIDHSKIYEVNFSIHHVSGGLFGQRYFGMYADGNNSVQSFDTNGNFVENSGNFYFWYGQMLDGETRKMRAYIIGADVDVSAVPESLNVFFFCRLNPGIKRVGLRALSYYNGGVVTTDRWLNPSVTVLGGGQISASQIIGNSGLFDKFKARIGAFGGLTANEIQADTALINKLVGTSALFNDLVARLAVFGGLTANSIASDAILGRHIKAGEKISSPIIEGGEVRLIGSAFMKVQSATAFGPDGLVEWYGPKLLLNGSPDWANLRKSNAITYLAANGDAYFGGSLSAGVLKNGAQNTTIVLYPAASIALEVGAFGTNGKPKSVVVSYSCSANYSQTVDPGNVTTAEVLHWKVQRFIAGSWQDVSGASGTFTGTVFKDVDTETWPTTTYRVSYNCAGSMTFVDSNASTANTTYRIYISSHSRPFLNTIVSRQTLSLISTEQ
ncbi:phage tail protein [Shewanella sp. 8A]|uniref:phage tail tip protein J-related protein n=1 Tax=Shewanella sp. 8A TaxID=2943323 RepID=UPI00201AD77D|nr:phage tail protein [Shewanella sp. 8A]